MRITKKMLEEMLENVNDLYARKYVLHHDCYGYSIREEGRGAGIFGTDCPSKGNDLYFYMKGLIWGHMAR